MYFIFNPMSLGFCWQDRKFKEQKKQKNWRINVCKKIAEEQNFPNKEIIDMYLCNDHGSQNGREHNMHHFCFLQINESSNYIVGSETRQIFAGDDAFMLIY